MSPSKQVTINGSYGRSNYIRTGLLAMTTSLFHCSFMLTEPWLILHGMDPAEYTCANEFPFFSANGSIVLIEVNFAEGNAVKPLFYFTGSTTAAINFRSTFRCLLDQWFLH